MLEFKDGGFKIATKSKCPIVPVGITGSADVFENHFPLIKSTKVTVTFAEPNYTADLSREETKGLSARVKGEIQNIISK